MFFVSILLLILAALVAGRPRRPAADDGDALDEAALRDLGLSHRELVRWRAKSSEHLFH